jgi:hypothetical protein
MQFPIELKDIIAWLETLIWDYPVGKHGSRTHNPFSVYYWTKHDDDSGLVINELDWYLAGGSWSGPAEVLPQWVFDVFARLEAQTGEWTPIPAALMLQVCKEVNEAN